MTAPIAALVDVPDQRRDFLHLAESLMDTLSDVRLEPYPHFRILPPGRESGERKLWQAESRNEVGYIFEDRRAQNRVYSTKVLFKARASKDDIREIRIDISKDGLQSGLNAEFAVGSNAATHLSSDTRDLTVEIPPVGGLHQIPIRLHLVKDIRRKGNVNVILFKLANETERSREKRGYRSFDFGNLLDLSVEEHSDGPIDCDVADIKGYGLLPRPTSKDGRIILRDYLVTSTHIPKPKTGSLTIRTLSGNLKAELGQEIHGSVVSFIESKIESEGSRLYGFQVRAIEELFRQIHGEKKPCIIIARTAAGKTEAFLVPILSRIVWLKEHGVRGTKALFFYPTKALASDQLQRILEFVSWINNDRDSYVTVGVFHGDIEEKLSLKIPLPLRCVRHDQELDEEKIAPADIRLTVGEDGELICPRCKIKYPYVILDRYSSTVNPPDIMIMTPDIVNRIMMSDRSRHVFFGASSDVRTCPSCRIVLREDRETCDSCGTPAEVIRVKPDRPPEMVVLDELHLFNSIFGGNVSGVLARLSALFAKYRGCEWSWRPQFVATSATIKNPRDFGKDFFGMPVSVIQTSRDDYDYSKTWSKVVVFTAPRAYRMINTVSYAIYTILAKTDLRVLVFVNSLAVSSMLLNEVRHRLSADSATSPLLDLVDGHSSNYTKQERALVEEKFNSGAIRVLVATSTLEVGVDFRDLSGLILYGAPYSINNYLQRIGRAGRNNDAMVLAFLNPDDPIDLYYFRNAMALSRDPTAMVEYPPFPTGNQIMRDKHVLCTIYDIAKAHGRDEGSLLEELRSSGVFHDSCLGNHLNSIWSKEDIQHALDLLRDTTQGVQKNDLPDFVRSKFSLLDIRKVDQTIEVKFEEPNPALGNRRRQGNATRPSGTYRRNRWLDPRDADTLRRIRGWR